MLKLIIENIDEYNYILVDKEKNKYKLNIEFYDFNPNIGDIIYLNKKNLLENVLYAYGPLNDQYTKREDSDLIKIIHADEIVYLQRYYG